MAQVPTATQTGQKVAGEIRHSDALAALARWGLAARATNYVLVGVLVIALALGSSQGETDQHGALEQTARHTGGAVLVWLVAIGLAAYVLWRLTEAAFGIPGKQHQTAARWTSVWRAVVYGVIAANAFRVALGARQENQSGKEQSYSATIMRHTGGRWLIGIVGIALAIFGVVLVVKGIKRKFEKSLELGRIPARARRLVEVLGSAGNIGRGLVFVMVGAFVVAAAVQYDPQKSAGLDGALRNLRNATGGPVLLIIVAVGLLLFGAYGYCEAAWKRTN